MTTRPLHVGFKKRKHMQPSWSANASVVGKGAHLTTQAVLLLRQDSNAAAQACGRATTQHPTQSSKQMGSASGCCIQRVSNRLPTARSLWCDCAMSLSATSSGPCFPTISSTWNFSSTRSRNSLTFPASRSCTIAGTGVSPSSFARCRKTSTPTRRPSAPIANSGRTTPSLCCWATSPVYASSFSPATTFCQTTTT